MNYYEEIKNKLIDDEVYARVKDYSKERHRVITYFEIGKLLSEAGSVYGEDVIGEYSKKLMFEVGKKFNKRTLFRMKQFYNIFSNEKVSPVVTQLDADGKVVPVARHLDDGQKVTTVLTQFGNGQKVAPVAPQLTWSHILTHVFTNCFRKSTKNWIIF